MNEKSKWMLANATDYWYLTWAILPGLLAFLTAKLNISLEFSRRDEFLGLLFPRFIEASQAIADQYGNNAARFYSEISSSVTVFFCIVSTVIVFGNVIAPRDFIFRRDLVGPSRRDVGILLLIVGLIFYFMCRNLVLIRVQTSEYFEGSLASYIPFFKEYVFSFGVFSFTGMGLLLVASYWLRSDLK